MNKYNLLKKLEYAKKSNNKYLPIIVLMLVLVLALLFFLYFLTNNPTRDFSDYREQAADILEYDRLLANRAKVDIEQEIGSDVYHTLVLGGDTDTSSDLYAEYTGVYGGAAEQARDAAELVSIHESQIQARGGVSSLDDLQELSTSQVEDSVAYASIVHKTANGTWSQASD